MLGIFSIIQSLYVYNTRIPYTVTRIEYLGTVF
jgi:hypothetical protein